MNRGGGVHTTPAAGAAGWWNKYDCHVVTQHRRKSDAVVAGREIARHLHVEHTIHRRNGRISEKNSYGNDPCPPRDGR